MHTSFTPALRLGLSLALPVRAGSDCDQLLNALDSRDHDIDYYYASQLPGAAEPVDDIHFHGFEPRALRLSLRYEFD